MGYVESRLAAPIYVLPTRDLPVPALLAHQFQRTRNVAASVL